MIRVSAILFLGVAACAHDHVLDRREVGAMENASPAISPWIGPEANPILVGQTDGGPEAVVNRVHGMAVQVFAAGSGEKINVASGVLAGGGLVLTDLRALLVEDLGGGLQPAAEIAVLTMKGAFPARLAGGALDADVAVLELPEAARALEGPPLADAAGQLAGLLVGPSEHDVVLVPAARLLPVLTHVRASAPQPDDHI
jgi:hypothetical protein